MWWRFSNILNVPVQRNWSDHIYSKGCITALEDWLPGNLYTVAIIFIVISLLQVLTDTCTASILILYQYCINTDTLSILHQYWLVCSGFYWFVLVCAVAHVPDVSVSDGGDIPGPDSDLWHPKGQIQLLKWPLQKAESKPAGRGLCVLGRSLSVWGGV